MTQEQSYKTVDIERRGYGRRYTWLPVDDLTRHEFMINCVGAYVQPEMIDIRRDDIVRWRESGQIIQGRITEVIREGQIFRALIDDVRPLPPEAFYP